jgi:hypothetical protein
MEDSWDVLVEVGLMLNFIQCDGDCYAYKRVKQKTPFYAVWRYYFNLLDRNSKKDNAAIYNISIILYEVATECEKK